MSEGLAELLQSCSIIEDKTKKDDDENGEQQRTDTINIPSELSRVIIGPGGRRIRQLQSQTGAKINIKQVSTNKADSTVILKGTAKSVTRAKVEIEKMRQKKIKET